jgi:hypothetical protein
LVSVERSEWWTVSPARGAGDVPAGLVAELMVAVAQQDEVVDPYA